METTFEVKNHIVNHIREKLKNTVAELSHNINMAKESRDSETKSSVGDKYETSREMVNIEIEKLSLQLSKTLILLNELEKINFQKEYRIVEFGSLVFTNNANYFISFGLGKIEIEKVIFFGISLESPIGKAMKGKKKGDTFRFQSNEVVIKEIV